MIDAAAGKRRDRTTRCCAAISSGRGRDARIMEWNGLRLMTGIKGRGADPGVQASISKVYRKQRAHPHGGDRDARDGRGQRGHGAGYGLNRLQQVFLASRAEAIYGGTTQIQYNVLAERTLGLPREPRPS